MIVQPLMHLRDFGVPVKTGSWQGTKEPPRMIELIHIRPTIRMRWNTENIPSPSKRAWAFKHFAERVSGEPLNPPPSHFEWHPGTDQYLSKVDKDKFSHTYPERFWPKDLMTGIRFDVGDLGTLVDVLRKDPTTRQAVLPMFYPEDLTAALQGERVPCSLSWHFMIRNDRLDVSYAIRSCDAVRHYRQDVFFANELAKWVIKESGIDCDLGNLYMTISSFHMFANDRYALEKEIKQCVASL